MDKIFKHKDLCRVSAWICIIRSTRAGDRQNQSITDMPVDLVTAFNASQLIKIWNTHLFVLFGCRQLYRNEKQNKLLKTEPQTNCSLGPGKRERKWAHGIQALTCRHCMPEEFDNAALFLGLGLPSTLIRHENGAFRKRFSNRRNLKTPAFRFRVDWKHFQNEDILKRWSHNNHVISLPEFFSKQIQISGDYCVF